MFNKALHGIRVLDLTNETGVYAAKLFADLGAEVIRIIPPSGDPVEHLGPFIDGEIDALGSIPYHFFNTNKKSVRLNLQTNEGKKIFADLVEESHVVIETFHPDYLPDLGIGYEQLKLSNPELVYTSITPFGQSGPYRDFEATPLVALAMGGLLSLGGYPDTEPIAVCARQANFAASLYGAVGTMFALLHAEMTGVGQFVDVSMQETVAMALENAAQFYSMEGVIRKRQGAHSQEAGMGLYPCKDGYIYVMASGLGWRSWQSLITWMAESGKCDMRQLYDKRWKEQSYRMTAEAKNIFYDQFTKFSREYKKIELYEQGQQRNIPICPVNTPEDIANSPQLAARGFFQTMMHPALNKRLAFPGAPYRLSETPWSIGRLAPAPGEDTAGILARSGVSRRDMGRLRETGVV